MYGIDYFTNCLGFSAIATGDRICILVTRGQHLKLKVHCGVYKTEQVGVLVASFPNAWPGNKARVLGISQFDRMSADLLIITVQTC